VADYFDQEWNGLTIRLRPNDKVRDPISRFPFLLDVIPYFSFSYVSFDLRVFLPRKESDKWYSGMLSLFPEFRRMEQGSFSYEWQLCDDDNQHINKEKKNSIKFFNDSGNGVVEYSTEKKKMKELRKAGYIVVSDHEGHWFRKRKAVDIGILNKYTHYNILMRFITNSGIASDWKLFTGFQLFDKDNFRMSIFLPVIVSAIVTLLMVFLLRGCGMQPL
jgi:hypothetical protein